MDERYVACIIIGHGGMMTVRNENPISIRSKSRRNQTNKIRWKHEEDERRIQPKEHRIMPMIIDLPINISLCTFAVPAESCAYPEDKLIALKDEMIYRLELHSENINNDIFKNIVHTSQRSHPIGFTYSSNEWAPYFTKRHEYSERWINGNKCINKKFTDCHELPIDCGVYILQNNVGIENGTILNYGNNGILFSELFDYFIDEYNVNKMYILDTTCSDVYNPEMNEYINDKYIINNIFKHGISLISGGKKNKKYTLKKKVRKIRKNKKKIKK